MRGHDGRDQARMGRDHGSRNAQASKKGEAVPQRAVVRPCAAQVEGNAGHKIGLGMTDLVAKSLQAPDGSDVFLDDSRRGRTTLATVVVGHGVYRPGWRWSAHVRPMTGHESEAHVGYVISGRMVVRGPDGAQVELGPGDAFEAPPGHDAWVVGDEPCVALDFAARSSADPQPTRSEDVRSGHPPSVKRDDPSRATRKRALK